MKEALTQMLTNVAIAMISVATFYIMFLLKKVEIKIKADTEKIKDERQRQLVNGAFDHLNTIVVKTVTKIEQTAAEGIRKAVKDGSADRDELLKLGEEAYKEITSTMKPEYHDLLENEIGDLETFIRNMIEEKVFEIKKFGICSG